MSTFVTRIALLVVVSLFSWYRDPRRLAMYCHLSRLCPPYRPGKREATYRFNTEKYLSYIGGLRWRFV